MSRNLGIRVGFGTSRHKFGSRSFSSIETKVTEKSTRTRPRDSDDIIDEDDGAYAEDDKRTVSSRLNDGFSMFEHE